MTLVIDNTSIKLTMALSWGLLLTWKTAGGREKAARPAVLIYSL